MRYEVKQDSFSSKVFDGKTLKITIYNNCPNAEQLAHQLCDKLNKESEEIWSSVVPDNVIGLLKNSHNATFSKERLCDLFNALEEWQKQTNLLVLSPIHEELIKILKDFGIGEKTSEGR